MHPSIPRSELLLLILIILAYSARSITRVCGPAQTSGQSPTDAVLKLIDRQQYNDAIARLEELLERNPRNPEALTI